MTKPIVRVDGRIDSISNIEWDEQGSSIMFDIKYIPKSPAKPLTLSDKLDCQFNIRESNHFLIGGFFDMMLDPQKRILDWSIYTNPKNWIRGTRDFEEAAPATVYIDADYDEDRRAYVGEPTEFYEAVRGAFYLSWEQSAIWYEVAPRMALGVTKENHLAELRLDDFFLPEAEQKVERVSIWTKLKRFL